MKYLRNIALILSVCCYFYGLGALATTVIPDYSATTDTASSYVTNYAPINANKISQYANLLANTPEGGAVIGAAEDAYSALSSWASGFFVVNPFSPNPLKPNFGKCFASDWSVASDDSSTAFLPKIKATSRIVIACIGYKGTVTLHGFGECKFINIIRVCARNTAPCTHGNDRCCSSQSNDTPGSTSCNAPDPNSSLCPNCAQKQMYRTCAFEDPMFPADATDTKMNMPFHEKTAVPPAVTGGNTVIAAGAFLIAAAVIVPGLGEGAMMVGAAMMLAGGIMDLIQFITSKMNYTVIGNRGCIDLPLTPFPPPYCSPINGFIPQADLLSICHYSAAYAIDPVTYYALTHDSAGNPLSAAQIAAVDATNYKQVSTSDFPCEITGTAGSAEVYSTFESPIVRLFFSNPLPACATGFVAPEAGTLVPGNDACVISNTLDTAYNIWKTDRNVIPTCSATITNNCVSFPSGRNYSFPYRPYYNFTNTDSLGLPAGAATSNSPFVVLAPMPPSSTAVAPALVFAGVNDSKYIDITPGNLIKITDFIGFQRQFLIGLSDIGDETCIFERVTPCGVSDCTVTFQLSTDVPVGCVKRPVMFSPPKVTACNNNNLSTCNYLAASGSSLLVTQPRIYVSIGNPAKIGIIGVDLAVPTPIPPGGGSISGSSPANTPPVSFCVNDDITTNGNSTSNPSPCSIYASSVFSAYVTDLYNQTPDTATNGTITPTDNSGKLSAGIQYINGIYCRGASRICLNGYSDSTKQVVAKLKSYNVTSTVNGVTSTITQTVVSNNVQDRVIPLYNAATDVGTISTFFDANSNYLTSKTPIQRVAIGGINTNTAQPTYYENLACTSDPNNSCTANGTPTGNTSTTVVPTNCQCNHPTTCTITGCEWAFIPTGGSAAAIGSYNSSTGQYTANAICTSDPTRTCTANGSPPTGNTPATVVPTICKCTQNNACTITGCEWAFLASTTNSPVSIGGYDLNSKTYYANPICTSDVTKICSAPTSDDPSNPITYPAATTCQCLNATTNVMEPCTIAGCEFAFQPSSPSSITTASGFQDSTHQYCLYGGTPPSNCNDSTNPAQYGLRNANAMELGLCAPTVQPSCPAINHANASDSTASSDGYANWAGSSLGDPTVTGTCITGTIQNPNGKPTRSCVFINNGFEQIILPDGTTGNGCPIYAVAYNSVTNPCTPLPAWWPSQFLANTTYQGAIFNQFNVNYDYHSNGKFVPTHSNSYQETHVPEQWVISGGGYDSCHSYGTLFTLNNTKRNTKDGDEEMLFMTAAQWVNLWNSYDLKWLFATPSNIPSGATYSNYDGCYVYDVSNNISASHPGITVGMKICKYQDNVSFSLVDTTANTYTDYRNNAYIMQSNIIDYNANNGKGDASVSYSGAGKDINHGIVVARSGFSSTTYFPGNLPSGFVSTSTAESIDIVYSFQSQVDSYNKSCGDCPKHHHCRTNNVTATISAGCALAVYRGGVVYPYSYGNPAGVIGTSPAYYIPLTPGNNGEVNLSIFNNDQQADHHDGTDTCTLDVAISNYQPGNSAANKSMFLWSSPTHYNACNGSVAPVIVSNPSDDSC